MSDLSQTPAETSLFARLFTDHPASVNESYWGHMRFALSFSFWMALAAMAALVHAFLPALCETTASRILKRMQAKMDARH